LNPTPKQYPAKILPFSYNSTIFSSLANNSYDVFSVNEAWGVFNNNTDMQAIIDINEIQWNSWGNFSWAMSFADDFNQMLQGGFNTLEPPQCLDAYAQEFQPSSSNLYVVTSDNVSNIDPNKPALLFAYSVADVLPSVDPYHWMCSQMMSEDIQCAEYISHFRGNISDWRPFGHQVSYCLTGADPNYEQCRVQVSLTVAMIVGIVNLVQVIIMCIAMWAVKGTPLLTQGDAVLSFLEDPDPAMESMCLLDKTDAKRFKAPRKRSQSESQLRRWLSSPKRLVAARKRWHTAVGKTRWIGLAIL
jgi:hypothetical protein